MSKHINQTEPITRVAAKIPALQDATSEVDNAAAAALSVNLTDLHCLAILVRVESVSAGALAEQLRLTRGAMTVVLDRLARAKLAERRGDPADRRSVLVAATASAKRRVQEIWKPIEQEGIAVLSDYSQRDLAIIEDFLDRARAVQVKHAERIRTLHKGQTGKRASAKRVKPRRPRAKE